MAVRIIKKSWWVDIRHNRLRHRIKSPENSRAGALAYEALIRQKLAHGQDIYQKDISHQLSIKFIDYSKEWLKIYASNNNRPSEIRQKEFILRKHLVPFFGSLPLDKISNQKVEEYKSYKLKQNKWAKKTINNHLAILGKCLRIAEEWEIISRVPKIKLFKIPPQKFDFLSIEESKQLLSSTDDIWNEMILIALKTGLRLGEITALDWSDINFKQKQLTVRRSLVRNIMNAPKNNKMRYIPLTNEACLVLYKRAKQKGYVFSDKQGKPFKAECARRTLHRICEKASLRKVGWHTLRHTFASHLTEAGASLKAVQELLGHSDIKMTMRYAHLSPSALNNTIKLLETNESYEIFGQPVGNRQYSLEKISKSEASNQS